MTDLIKRDDAPDQIFASQGDDGWRWPRASKFPEQGDRENVKYVRADLVDPNAIRNVALQARIEELENSLAWYQMMDAMSSDHVVELTDKLEAAETKLTKAIEALRNILSGDDLYPWRIAREVLAELGGGE